MSRSVRMQWLVQSHSSYSSRAPVDTQMPFLKRLNHGLLQPQRLFLTSAIDLKADHILRLQDLAFGYFWGSVGEALSVDGLKMGRFSHVFKSESQLILSFFFWGGSSATKFPPAPGFTVSVSSAI